MRGIINDSKKGWTIVYKDDVRVNVVDVHPGDYRFCEQGEEVEFEIEFLDYDEVGDKWYNEIARIIPERGWEIKDVETHVFKKW